MIFDYNISVISIALLAVALLGLIYIATVYVARLRAVCRRRNVCDDSAPEAVSALPKTTVVVYTHNDDNQLAENLPLILDQDFNGQFEVVVVNDGTAVEADMIITRLKAKYSNLYLTFAPDNSRNVSRKKLAITLGVKAAKGDVIVITDATTRLSSSKWLERMVAPFADASVGVVLGYNTLNMPQKRWFGRLALTFDYAADSVTWLAAAIKGHPYRGCGSNIAYRKELFFANKGFSKSLNLRSGEDDLFVNEIADHDNTVVEIAAQTIGSTGTKYGVRKECKRSRLDHAFTGRKLPKTSRRIMALGEWLMCIVPVCAIAGAWMAGVCNLFGWIIAAVIIITMYVVVCVFWRKTLSALGLPKMMLTIPLIAMTRPMRNIMVNLRCTNRSNACYTWQ